MQSSIEIDKINNGKIKKIFSKNEIEDIEKCLISMSEEGTGRHEVSSTFSDKKLDNQNNINISDIDNTKNNKFEINSKLKIAKENFKFKNNENNLENNPNLIYSNKNINFKNLKSKNDMNIKQNNRTSSKTQNKTEKNFNSNNNFNNSSKFGINKRNPSTGKFKNDNYINIDNQSSNESINSNLNIKNKNNSDILSSLPDKIFIDSNEYNKLKYKAQADIRIDELVI